MAIRLPLAPALLAMALVACDDGGSPAPTGVSPSPTPVAVPSPKPLTALPKAARGRWGALPSDCGGKGATRMMVAADTLTFAASTAKVRDIVEVRPTTFTATLDYRNRMGKWSSPTTITLQEGGKTLQKQDTHPSAMTTYTRCPA